VPYVAPEVLRGKPYTQTADIYSFGIVAYEVLSGLPPYCDLAHDEILIIGIAVGRRLDLDEINAPQLLKDLIKRCWETNPFARPTSRELKEILQNWYYNNDIEFNKQKKEIENLEKDKKLLSNTDPFFYQIHHQAIYTSRLINTEEIARLLHSEKVLEQELKKIEKEINQSLTDEQKGLVKEFIQIRKRVAKDKENTAAEDES
jgi:serine/threonine protein kinase